MVRFGIFKESFGLTATPIRRDGHQPIIFMQCGPIRHSAARPESSPVQLEVWPQSLPAPEIPPESGIQDVFRILANDTNRSSLGCGSSASAVTGPWGIRSGRGNDRSFSA